MINHEINLNCSNLSIIELFFSFEYTNLVSKITEYVPFGFISQIRGLGVDGTHLIKMVSLVFTEGPVICVLLYKLCVSPNGTSSPGLFQLWYSCKPILSINIWTIIQTRLVKFKMYYSWPRMALSWMRIMKLMWFRTPHTQTHPHTHTRVIFKTQHITYMIAAYLCIQWPSHCDVRYENSCKWSSIKGFCLADSTDSQTC